MLNVGPSAPWRYAAAITNAIPRGEIHAAGFFGPWQTDSPGEYSVSGHYNFDHADLNTIRGIGGILSTKTKPHIRPGKERVTEKLSLKGNFKLQKLHFTNPAVQDKVDMMSLRAQGKPKEAKPGAMDVSSHMNGTFSLNEGVLRFSNLAYVLPGARVNLEGIYSLDGQQFDFHGRVRTEVSLSQTVDSPWLSLLLKVVSPFFSKKGGGAEIPVRISGTKSEPKFGLDVLKGHSNNSESVGERKR